MSMRSACAALALALTATPALAGPKVAIETSEGTIIAELYDKQAPLTARNFLRYVVNGKFNGTTFYRAARNRANPKVGYIQGGIDKDYRRAYFSIDHEPTTKTGLKHTHGTLSMARNLPGTAMGEFFITVGPASYLDARPGNVGFAAFGRVIKGMDIVKKILAAPTWLGRGAGAFKDQIIKDRVKIIRARRIG